MANWVNIFDSDFASNIGLTPDAWVPTYSVGNGWFTAADSTDTFFTEATTVLSDPVAAQLFPGGANLRPELFDTFVGDFATSEYAIFPPLGIGPNLAVRMSAATDPAIPFSTNGGFVNIICQMNFGTPLEGFGIGPGFQQLGVSLRFIAGVSSTFEGDWVRTFGIELDGEEVASGPAPLGPGSEVGEYSFEYGDGVARIYVDGLLRIAMPVALPADSLPADCYVQVGQTLLDELGFEAPAEPPLVYYLTVWTAAEGDATIDLGDEVSTIVASGTMVATISKPAALVSDLALTDTLTGRAILNALLFSTAELAANSSDLGAGVAWVVNAETGATSTYEGFDFNSLVKWGDTYLGAKADGVYELEGANDSGQPIRAQISFGMSTFGTLSKKMVEHAYLGVASDGYLYVRITADGQTYTYKTDRSAQDFYTQRARLGKGLRATHITLEVLNEVGSDFELSDVQFLINFLSRRI